VNEAVQLSGPRKAAIALLSLDEELATAVLGKMAEPDIRKLCAAVDELGEIRAEVILDVLEDLERGITDPLAMVRNGGTAYMRKLADKALGTDRAQKLFGAPPAPTVEPIQLLRTARVAALAQILIEEHPQIAAVVMTQLPARVVAKTLALMGPEIAADLTARIAELEEIPEHAVAEASESLVRALEAAGGLSTSDARAEFDGLAFSASIVNEMTSEEGDALLGRIAEANDQVASRIRESMFTFEDLGRIDPREMGGLLRSVQSETLVTALQTATPELREHFLSSLSQRAAATLRDDLSAAAPKRVSEVETAQREIVEAAMRLAGEGKLTLPPRGGEE
jgi:flagellar motor switch protein FliG